MKSSVTLLSMRPINFLRPVSKSALATHQRQVIAVVGVHINQGDFFCLENTLCELYDSLISAYIYIVYMYVLHIFYTYYIQLYIGVWQSLFKIVTILVVLIS